MSSAVLSVILAALALVYGGLRLRRRQIYRALARMQEAIDAHRPAFHCRPAETLPLFTDGWAVIPDFLPPETFQRLRDAALGRGRRERSLIPGHKQGGTVAYEELHRAAPEIVAFYRSPVLWETCSRIVGEPLLPTPLHDQSSCSLLIYDRPRDHIGWHYDHNFYRGRHFTVLLPVVNEGPDGALSSARLVVMTPRGERIVATAPNTLVLFEGARLRHKVTRLKAGERRVVISMTLCTAPQSRWWQDLLRRCKDTAYFGPRALWA